MINETTQMIDTHKILYDIQRTDQTKTDNSFAGNFKKLFEETNRKLEAADQLVLKANTGGKADLHEMMIAMEKADISLRLMVQVRNKAIDAYQEIMRMQV